MKENDGIEIRRPAVWDMAHALQAARPGMTIEQAIAEAKHRYTSHARRVVMVRPAHAQPEGSNHAAEHEALIERAVAMQSPIERQCLGVWHWHVITQAEAEQAIAMREHAWLRLHCVERTRSA